MRRTEHAVCRRRRRYDVLAARRQLSGSRSRCRCPRDHPRRPRSRERQLRDADDCASEPLPQAIAFDNTLASTNGPPEPTCFFFNTDLFVGDHWFQWVAPANGDFSFSSCGNTTVDTKLAIYAGAGCPTLAPLDCSDDDCGLQTRVELIGATMGSTYTLRIAHYPAYPGGQGTVLVENYTPPSHTDGCSGAGVIDGEGTFAFNNVGATTDGQPEPSCAFFGQTDITNDVWWRWTPTFSGDYSFATCGGGPDTKIALYALQPCPPTGPLGCLDDSCALQQDLVVTALVANSDYLIRLGNFPGAAAGVGDLVITRVGGPPPPGANYCSTLPNSSGSASSISAQGSNSVAANDLELNATQVPVMQPGIFYYGPLEISVPFGHGTRCVGGGAGTIERFFPFAVSDATGLMAYSVNNTSPTHAPQLGVPGSTWKFQAWFRDPAAGGPGFNLSDGYSITLTP